MHPLHHSQPEAVSYNAAHTMFDTSPAGAAMRTLLLVIMTVIALTACTTIDSKKKSAIFETTQLKYSKAIRWGEFGLADSMRRLPDGQHATQDAESLEHIKVTSCETISTSSLEDGSRLRVTARIDYYHDDGMKVNSLLDNQVWEYDEDASTWYIITPLPVFK